MIRAWGMFHPAKFLWNWPIQGVHVLNMIHILIYRMKVRDEERRDVKDYLLCSHSISFLFFLLTVPPSTSLWSWLDRASPITCSQWFYLKGWKIMVPLIKFFHFRFPPQEGLCPKRWVFYSSRQIFCAYFVYSTTFT